MDQEQNLEEIKKFIKDFFQRTTIDLNVDFLPIKILEREYSSSGDVLNKEDNSYENTIILPVEIKAENAQILIGEKGQTLSEMQHLLRLALRKKFNQNILVDLDINDYKKKKTDFLKEMALSVADEVALLGKEKMLPPMPSYERRIIHMELSKRSDIAVESLGDGREKKMIIRPA